MITTDVGSARRASASRLVITTAPSISSPGRVRSALPVARRVWRAARRSGLPSFVTTTPPRVSRPVPSTYETLFFLNRNSTPFAWRSATSRLRWMTRPKSARMLSATMPRAAAVCSSANRAASARIAFDGMHPQLPQTPPGLSRSTTAVRSPSWAARIAATYPPGPAPTTIRSYSGMAFAGARSEEERERLLEEHLQPAQESPREHPVDDAVIAGERDRHRPARHDASLAHHRRLADRADREDGRLGRIDDGGEVRHREHPEIRDGERPARQVVTAEPSAARA